MLGKIWWYPSSIYIHQCKVSIIIILHLIPSDPWCSGSSHGSRGGEEHRKQQQQIWSQEKGWVENLNSQLVFIHCMTQARKQLPAQMWRRQKECSWWLQGWRTRISPTPVTKRRGREKKRQKLLLPIDTWVDHPRIFVLLPDILWSNSVCSILGWTGNFKITMLLRETDFRTQCLLSTL